MFDKIIIFFMYFTLSFPSTHNVTIKKYENYLKLKSEVENKETLAVINSLKNQKQITDRELAILYDIAEFRNYVERQQLENELIRAKIYWYYYNGYRRYYYYDWTYNVIFIN